MARWREAIDGAVSARLDPWARERGCARLDAGSECVAGLMIPGRCGILYPGWLVFRQFETGS